MLLSLPSKRCFSRRDTDRTVCAVNVLLFFCIVFPAEITNASSSEEGDDESDDESDDDADDADDDGSDESGEESEEFEDQGSDSDASEEMERQQAEAEVSKAGGADKSGLREGWIICPYNPLVAHPIVAHTCGVIFPSINSLMLMFYQVSAAYVRPCKEGGPKEAVLCPFPSLRVHPVLTTLAGRLFLLRE